MPCNLSVTVSVSAVMSSVEDEAGEKYCAHRGPYRNDGTANDSRRESSRYWRADIATNGGGDHHG